MSDYLIPNLVNACNIMTLLSNSEHGLAANEIESKLNIPRTTVFRILKTLCFQQITEKQGRVYSVGNSLIDMGLQLTSASRLSNRAKPVLRELAKLSGFTAHLAVPSGYKSLILEVCDSPNPIRVASRKGTLASLNCSSTGKIFAAHLFRDDIAEIQREVGFEKRTNLSISSVDEMEKEMLRVLTQGYGMDNREYNNDVICLAAPIFDHHGTVISAIGVTSPASIFTASMIPDVAKIVKASATKLYLAGREEHRLMAS